MHASERRPTAHDAGWPCEFPVGTAGNKRTHGPPPARVACTHTHTHTHMSRRQLDRMRHARREGQNTHPRELGITTSRPPRSLLSSSISTSTVPGLLYPRKSHIILATCLRHPPSTWTCGVKRNKQKRWRPDYDHDHGHDHGQDGPADDRPCLVSKPKVFILPLPHLRTN